MPVWLDGARLPIGVQVIAPAWREDLALRVAHHLEARGVAAAPVAPLAGMTGGRAVIGDEDIDLPEVRAEVEAAFAAYERALVGNDVAALDRLFLDRPDHHPLRRRREPPRLRRDRRVPRRALAGRPRAQRSTGR